METIEEELMNFSDMPTRQRFLSFIRCAAGLCEVTIRPFKGTRTQKQNRWYWKCIVGTVIDYYKAQGQVVTKEEVHDHFKLLFIPTTLTHPKTGEVLSRIPGSSRILKTNGFSEFAENCIAYIATTWGQPVPTPEEYWGEPVRPAKAGLAA